MTVFGRHTVAETRDLIRAIEFRTNQYVKQWSLVKQHRSPQVTIEQQKLDSDITTFVKRWTDVRDKQTIAMTASVLANPSVAPFLLPAEDQFVAVNNAATRDEPRLINIQARVDKESSELGLLPVDLTKIPDQNSPDADFAALQKLDSAIAAAGNPLGKPGGSDSVLKSPLGIALIAAGTLGIVGGALYVKKVIL